MTVSVPSEHPDYPDSTWQLTPTQSGGVAGRHTGTLENFESATEDEAKTVVAANEARYKGDEPKGPDEGNGGNGGNGEPA